MSAAAGALINFRIQFVCCARFVNVSRMWFGLISGSPSFGGRPLPAFVGLAIPALTRLRGYYTHVTLHQLVETVDLKDAGVKSHAVYKLAGSIATQHAAYGQLHVGVLPAYRRILQDKYRRGSVFVQEGMEFSRAVRSIRILRNAGIRHTASWLSGKWGTYKRLDCLMAAFHKGGGNHSGGQVGCGWWRSPERHREY